MKKFIPLFFPLFLFSYTIDFDTAINITLEQNKELQAKKLDIEVAKQDLIQAKGYEFGKMKIEENISRTNHAGYVFGMKLASREADFGSFGFDEFLSQMPALMGGVPGADTAVLGTQPDQLNYPEARTNYETKISYEVPIFTGFKLQNAKEMARLQILAQEAKFSYDTKKLQIEVLKAYNGAVAAKYFIEAIKKAQIATKSFVDMATQMNIEGFVTKIDVNQATVFDLDVETKLIEAQNKFDLAIAYLQFLTNDANISDVKEFVIFEKNEIALDKEAFLNDREDFQWMQYNTQTMKKNIDFKGADLYPMVGAYVEYGMNDDSFDLSSDKDYYMGALGIKYTLFDGSVSSSEKQKAKIKYTQTKLYMDQMQNGIELEVKNNQLNLNAKRKIYHQKQKAQSLAQEILYKSEELYKNHLISMNDLLMQQAKNQEAIANTILAKYEYSLAQANYNLSLGKSLKD